MTGGATENEIREKIHELMPELWRMLVDLVGFKSVSADPTAPLRETAVRVAELLRGAGITSAAVETISHGGMQSAPLVYANEQGPVGAPTVLLYAHYDVQPADATQWKVTAPFEPKEVNNGTDIRLYGRGAADDKSGVVLHFGAIKALCAARSTLPLNVKIVIEGEEETGKSVLDEYLARNPTDPRFHADVIVIADTGNVAVGVPTLTTTLRGIVVVDVELETLEREVHSGMYGGPAPDAFMALVQMLATLLDNKTGGVAVPRLTTYNGSWRTVTEESFRIDAGVLPGVSLIGTDGIEKRLYGKPSINVVGLRGLPSMDKPTNVLCPKVTARISVRLAPNQKPSEAYTALESHLKRVAPWGLQPKITKVGEGMGFTSVAGNDSIHHELIEKALRDSYQVLDVKHAGQGGSIPLVNAFRTANPQADIVLWGCEEPKANIHGNDESVSQTELEHMTLAEAYLLHAVSGVKQC